MRIWKNSDSIFAIADEGKMFKLGTVYSNSVRLLSEDKATELAEVYYHNGREVTEDMHNYYALLHELKEIREWFASTDYIPNKVVVGEWEESDERFVAYCEERKTVRARQDEIRTLLGLSK